MGDDPGVGSGVVGCLRVFLPVGREGEALGVLEDGVGGGKGEMRRWSGFLAGAFAYLDQVVGFVGA